MKKNSHFLWSQQEWNKASPSIIKANNNQNNINSCFKKRRERQEDPSDFRNFKPDCSIINNEGFKPLREGMLYSMDSSCYPEPVVSTSTPSASSSVSSTISECNTSTCSTSESASASASASVSVAPALEPISSSWTIDDTANIYSSAIKNKQTVMVNNCQMLDLIKENQVNAEELERLNNSMATVNSEKSDSTLLIKKYTMMYFVFLIVTITFITLIIKSYRKGHVTRFEKIVLLIVILIILLKLLHFIKNATRL